MLRDVEIRTAAQAADYLFEVVRAVDGEPFTALVGSHELTTDDLADLSPEERAIYDREEARWAGVEAACEWLAREAALYDPTGADDPAKWRDGECATLNGDPLPETEAECLAAE